MLCSTSQVLRAGHVKGGHSSAVYGTVVASIYQVVWRSTHVFVYSVVRDSLGYRCTDSEWGFVYSVVRDSFSYGCTALYYSEWGL